MIPLAHSSRCDAGCTSTYLRLANIAFVVATCYLMRNSVASHVNSGLFRLCF